MQNGDHLIASVAFDRPGTYRITSVHLEHGDGLRRRVETVAVRWCFVVADPSLATTEVDLSSCHEDR
ncbi:MAG TPA: hypothetical protein VFJ85_06625 [Acidimicrobiales bacterium]|nr:hypothetical protein [Acidimicrobiales bacterium]